MTLAITDTCKLNPAQAKAQDVMRSDAMHVALGGGSRSGKTFLFLRGIMYRALKSPGSRHAALRFRGNSIERAIVLDTLPKMMGLCFPGLYDHCHYNGKHQYLTLPNKSEIWFSGLDDKERVEKILGNEYATLFFNECSQIPYQSVTMTLSRLAQKTENLKLKAYYDFNPPGKVHWTYRQFVEKKDPNTKQSLRNPEQYAFYLINPYDNKENIAPEYLALLESMPERERNRFLLGRFADASEGQLWSDELIANTRVINSADFPQFARIVVAVDPSGCSGPDDKRSDEIGITVCALGTNGHGYLIEDLSGRYGPAEWGKIVVDAYRRHKADRIVGEANYGGAMVEHVVRSVDADVPYQDANATRGKIVRAEPIAALYEQGKIHHLGFFPELEDQLCGFTPAGYTGLRSPDRADSLVWGFTVLFPGMTTRAAEKDWRPPVVHTAPRNAVRYSARRR